MNLNAELAAATESLYRTATRLQRVGLIVDRNALSPAHRRAAFALQCLTAHGPAEDESAPERALIGFAYPNALATPLPAHPIQITSPRCRR